MDYLGKNTYHNKETTVRMGREDRLRHMYVVGQTGTGKTNILKNMIIQDIRNGDGVCFIDPMVLMFRISYRSFHPSARMMLYILILPTLRALWAQHA